MAQAKYKKTRFSFKRLINNDKYLIIISLFLAVIVWTITSLNIGADQERTLNITVPITLGDQVSETLGMQYYSLQDTVEISVKISGAKYVIGQVTQDDFNISFDTSTVTKTGEQYIPIVLKNATDSLSYDVVEYYPSQIKGFFDVSDTKIVDVVVNYNKDFAADGYTIGKPVLSDEQVVVTGPKTYIDSIEKAQIDISIDSDSSATEPITDEYPIEIIGSQSIPSKYLTITSKTDGKQVLEKLSVTLPVLQVQKLPVIVTLEDQPSALPSNAISITYSPSIINAGILDSADISEAVIGTINYNEIPSDGKTFSFDASSLNGITVLDDIKTIDVKIAVDSNYTQKDITLKRSMVDVIGVPTGYKAVVKSVSAPSVAVICNKDNKDNINSAALTIKCDVSKQNETNTYPIVITISDNSSWIYGTYTAKVELVKQ